MTRVKSPVCESARCKVVCLLVTPLVLTGCPLSDEYYVETATGMTTDTSDTSTGGSSTDSTSTETSTTGGGGDDTDATLTGAESSLASASGGAASTSVATTGTGSGSTQTSSSTGGSGGSTACISDEEICDGLDNDCNDMVDDGACEANCVGFQLDAATYMYCGDATLGSDVTVRCASEGMVPVKIESALENTALVDAVAPFDAELGELNGEPRAFWMGASDIALEGTWRWLSDGTVFWVGPGTGTAINGAYTNWVPGRPNDSDGEDCGLVYLEAGVNGAVGEWNDVGCEVAYSFVCELL